MFDSIEFISKLSMQVKWTLSRFIISEYVSNTYHGKYLSVDILPGARNLISLSPRVGY